MKAAFAIILTVMLIFRVTAQVNTAPDMTFSVSFEPLADSPSNSVLSGQAQYYQHVPPEIYAGVYTNSLEVYIALPSPPQDAWLLEMDTNGSFTQVAEITNLIANSNGILYFDEYHPGPEDGFYFDQFFMLTTNQVRSLAEGNLFEEVDFADGSYFGNLTPKYVNAPTPVAAVLPPYFSKGYFGGPYTIIARNNRTASVVCDGSESTDPFYLPIQFYWSGWNGFLPGRTLLFTNTGVLATNTLALGTYCVSLQVGDELSVGSPFYHVYNLSVEVVTAGLEMGAIIQTVNDSTLPKNKKRILNFVLSTARDHFNRGNMSQGCSELKVYLMLVKSLHLDSITASILSEPAQSIINSFASTK